MEHISRPVRRALEECARAMEARNKVSGDRNGPNDFEPTEISGEESVDQSVGIRREGAADGKMNCGQPGFRVQSPSSSFERENETGCPSPEASLTADRNDREGSMLRVIGCNDNRAHASGTFWRWS